LRVYIYILTMYKYVGIIKYLMTYKPNSIFM